MSREIASNSDVAQNQVSMLQQAVATSNNTQNQNTDTQTTLQGNTKLHSVMEQEMNMASQFRITFQADATNIGRIAQAMEIQDQQLVQKDE